MPESTGLVAESDLIDFKSSKLFILDSGATSHTFHPTRDFIPGPKYHMIKGIEGNPQKAFTSHHSLFGDVLLLKGCPANLISFSKLVDSGWELDYKNSEDSFIASKGHNILRFQRNTQGLYVLQHIKSNSDLILTSASLINEHANRRDQARILEAIKLHENLGHVPFETLAQMLDHGQLLHTNLVGADARRAGATLGHCPKCLLGKMNRYARVTSELPRSDRLGKDLHIDLFFPKGSQGKALTFMICVDEFSGHLSIRQLPDRSSGQISAALEDLVKTFASRGFYVQNIHSDREKGIDSAKIRSLGCTHRLTTSQGHDPFAERGIQTLMKYARTIGFDTTYGLTGKLVPHLLYYSVGCLNTKWNVNCPAGSSPRILFTGEKLDVRLHLRAKFGEVLLFKQPYLSSGSSNQPRAHWGLVLDRDFDSPQGNMTVLDIDTWSIVNRSTFERATVPFAVQKRVYTYMQRDPASDFAISNVQIPVPSEVPSHQPAQQNEPTHQVEQHTNSAPQSEGIQVPSQLVLPPAKTQNENVVQLPHHVPPPDLAQTDETRHNKTQSEHSLVPPSPPGPYQESFGPSVVPVSKSPGKAVQLVPAASAAHGTPQERRRSDRRPKQRVLDNYDGNYFWNDKNEALDSTGRVVGFKGLLQCAFHQFELQMGLSTISVGQAMKIEPSKTIEAMKKELLQMLQRKVFVPASDSEVGGGVVIPSHMIIKLIGDICKARFVAGGNVQDKTLYTENELAGQTIKSQSLMTIFALAAAWDLDINTFDVKGAYLWADLPKSRRIFMKVKKSVADILVQVDPSYEKYRTFAGELYVLLKKACYGLVESAVLWQIELTSALLALGYVQNKYDPCVFTKMNGNSKVIVGIYVDDILVGFNDRAEVDRLIQGLTSRYGELKRKRLELGQTVTYRGLEITKTSSSIKVCQKGYIEELLAENQVVGTCKTPGNRDLLEVDTNSPRIPSKPFTIAVAKVLWLANQSRPEIKLVAGFLARRVAAPTVQDQEKLHKVLKYLNGTTSKGLNFTGNDINISIYADAGHMVNSESRGQTGVVVKMGPNTIFTESKRQSITAQSSCEAELIALNSATNIALYTKHFMEDLLGTKLDPIPIFQDNQSVIRLAHLGRVTQRTRHISMRYFNVTDQVNNKSVILKYLETTSMIADLLTKPLSGSSFSKLRAAILNEDAKEELGLKGVLEVNCTNGSSDYSDRDMTRSRL